MADLAKLVVKLEAQTAQYMQQLDKAEKRLAKFNSTSVGLAAGVGAAFGELAIKAAGQLLSLAKNAVDSADKISKLAQSTGASTEFLSELEYAADLSGASLDTLATAFNRLAKNSSEAASGSKTQTEAFDRLGVSVTDVSGKLKNSESLMMEVAEAFSGIEDGAAKAALAQEIFGKTGADLIPFLNNGKAGLEALRQEAQALGLTIDGETGKAAERFNDNLTRIGKVSQGLVTRFISQVLPAMDKISEAFVDAAKSGGALDLVVKGLVFTFKLAVSAGIAVVSAFQQVGLVIGGVGEAIYHAIRGNFSAAAEALKNRFQQASANIAKDADSIAAVWAETSTKVEQTAQKTGRSLKIVTEAQKKAGEEALKAKEKIEAMLTGLRQSIATYEQSEEATIRYRVTMGDLAEEFNKMGPAGAALRDELIRLTDLFSAVKRSADAAKEAEAKFKEEQLEIAAVVERTRTPLEQYVETVKRLNELRGKGLDQDTYARAIKQAQDALDQANPALQEALRIVEASKTPLQNYVDYIGRLNELMAMFPEHAEAFQIAAQRAFEEFTGAVDTFGNAAIQIGDAISYSIENAILEFKSFSDLLKNIDKQIAAILIRNFVTQPLSNSITDFLKGLGGTSSTGKTGNWIDGAIQGVMGLFAGFGADGLRVPAGQWGIAGENGPEAVFGGTSGATIVSPNQTPRYTLNINQTFAPNATRETFNQAAAAITRAQASTRFRGVS